MAPSPTAIAYGPVSVVDGAETCSISFGPSTTDTNGTEHMRGGTVECSDVANDPRVSGTYTGTYALDWWGTADHSAGALVQWGAERLVNAGGAWEGRLAGVYSNEQRDIITIWWSGTGGYAGLTYFEVLTGDPPWMLRGQVFPGTIPTATGPSAATPPSARASAPAATSADTAPASSTASAATHGPVSVVSGTSSCPTIDFGAVSTDADGTQHTRNGTMGCSLATDDPRVSGAYTASWNLDWWGDANHANGVLVQWGPARIANDGGTWEGFASGVYSTDRGDTIVTWYTGTGGYAGLTYFELTAGTGPWTIRGQIFPGEPPA